MTEGSRLAPHGQAPQSRDSGGGDSDNNTDDDDDVVDNADCDRGCACGCEFECE